MKALNKVINFGVCGYGKNWSAEKKSAINSICEYWMKNKSAFMKKAVFGYPYGNDASCLDATEEYSMVLKGHDVTLKLRISNPAGVVYPRSEGWYL